MTPKEKAQELVYKMKWEGEMSEEECFNDFAKECALIAVDEILNNENGTLDYESDIEYWKEVKKEINKL